MTLTAASKSLLKRTKDAVTQRTVIQEQTLLAQWARRLPGDKKKGKNMSRVKTDDLAKVSQCTASFRVKYRFVDVLDYLSPAVLP